MTAVSVIVPARNAADTIGATLEALAGQDLTEPFEVIVVDDASTDSTPQVVTAAAGPVQLVRVEAGGPGPARNAGAARATSPVLAFTDADCAPGPGWLRAGLAALADADLVQGAVEPDPGVTPKPFDRTITVRREYGLYETASMFVRRELFDRLGGFEHPLAARIGKPLGEDIWFGWRARRAGARVAFCKDAAVEHAVFRRTRLEFVSERLRLAYFPVLVRRVPELRDRFLWRRWFLNRRTAAFDAGIAGLVAGGAAGWATGSEALLLLALAAWLPYVSIAFREARGWGRRAPDVMLTGAVADLVGWGALLAGTARTGTPVL